MIRQIFVTFVAGGIIGLTAVMSPPTAGENADTAVPVFQARELARFDAQEGMQGVAVDEEYFYVVSDSLIEKRDKESGQRGLVWRGGDGAGARHINSCKIYSEEIICANSNYPEIPMASSIETFDKLKMTHKASHSLGVFVGSLTWLDKKDGFWWAAFAHYGVDGGTPGKDWTWTSFVKFDSQWRRLGGWIFSKSVLERMAPFSTSGGSWGPDGLLYVMGHDRPEMYVLQLPKSGSVLKHIATITLAAEGQAFAWDRSTGKRVLYAISRGSRQVVAFEIPEIPGAESD